MAKVTDTRERIMDVAEAAMLAKGFHATSIEEIIAALGITKSGFFYHFADKTALARALMERYLVQEEEFFDAIFDRGRELTDDPLQSFLISLKLLAEALYDLPTVHPGCLVATYCYQARLFDNDICVMMREGVLSWRKRFSTLLDEVEAVYPPRDKIDRAALADMINTVLEGGIVMSKALDDPRSIGDQLLLFRSYVKLLYSPAVAAA